MLHILAASLLPDLALSASKLEAMLKSASSGESPFTDLRRRSPAAAAAVLVAALMASQGRTIVSCFCKAAVYKAHSQSQVKNKCSDWSLEVLLPAFIGNYNRSNDRRTGKPTDGHESSREVTLPVMFYVE